jgi:hypothetical protein
MLLHIFAHPLSELVLLGMLGMHVDVAILIPSSSYCFDSQGIYVIPSMIGSPITKRSLTMLPSLLIQAHIFGQRVRFVPKLSRPHSFPSKSRFSLELSDISVVRDILEVLPEVLPCFPMTVWSSS